MAIVDPSEFDVVDNSEIIIGFVAAVGTPITKVQEIVHQALEERGYAVTDIRLSDLIETVEDHSEPLPVPPNEYERIKTLMDRGNALRERMNGGEVLAVVSVAHISDQRPEDEEVPALDGRAFLLCQLKHPDEVQLLRQIYGEAFHLVGVYSPESVRRETLISDKNMKPDEAEDLIKRDQGEDFRLGQQLRDTFHLADVIVPLHEPADLAPVKTELDRYLSLIFLDQQDGICSPTADEFGMYLAQSAAFRSADLSRQVGAAILSTRRDLISVGCNEVPAAGGGQYWCDCENDARDFKEGSDPNTRKKLEVLEEVLGVVEEGFSDLSADEKSQRVKVVAKRLGPTRMMNLTEFGRAVHAEMEALLSAGRNGTSVKGCTLYTTTFPCHNCAKHIVNAGISRVVYIEPYPRSLAMDHHEDALRLDEKGEQADRRVSVESFAGLAPRRFATIFSMLSATGEKYLRKAGDGEVLRSVLGLRTKAPALNYMQREAVAHAALKAFLARERQMELDLEEADS
ncbi:anti-phage dCTP deaminase [Gemmatimonadota bacterium]